MRLSQDQLDARWHLVTLVLMGLISLGLLTLHILTAMAQNYIVSNHDQASLNAIPSLHSSTLLFFYGSASMWVLYDLKRPKQAFAGLVFGLVVLLSDLISMYLRIQNFI